MQNITEFTKSQEGYQLLDIMLKSNNCEGLKDNSTISVQDTFSKFFATVPQTKIEYTSKKNWYGKTTTTKSYSADTLNTYDFGNSANAGVPILPYVYTGGSLYNPFLNITTIASFYSMYAQVTPVADAIDMITNAIVNIPIALYRKEITKDASGELVMSNEEYNPALEAVKKKKTKTKSMDGDYYARNNDKHDYILNVMSLLHNPNPIVQQNLHQFLKSSTYELLTTGNCFWVKEYDKGVTVDQLRRCEDVSISNLRVGKTFEFTQFGFETLDFYTVPTWRETKYGYSAGYVIEYNQIFIDIYGNLRLVGQYGDRLCEVYLVNMGIGNTFVGQSKLLRCSQFVQIHYLGALFTRSFFQNSGAPCALVQIKPHDPTNSRLSQDQTNQMAALIRDQLKGASNAGKHLTWTVPGYELTYTPISASIKDTDVQEQMKYASDMIYQSYSISSTLKSRSGDRYNILQEEVRFYKEAVFPVTDLIVSSLNSIFIACNKTMRESFSFQYNENAIPEFNAMEIEALVKAKDYFKINEGRKLLRLPDMGPEGDFIPLPNNINPLSADGLLNVMSDKEENI